MLACTSSHALMHSQLATTNTTDVETKLGHESQACPSPPNWKHTFDSVGGNHAVNPLIGSTVYILYPRQTAW